MATSQNPNTYTSDDKNKTTKNDREKIDRILAEFGLDPSEYLFNSPVERRSARPSAFSKYSPQTSSSISRPSPPVISGRPLSYIQPAPPSHSVTSSRPLSYVQQSSSHPVFYRRLSQTPSAKDMAQQQIYPRRTPPPPPSGPRYDIHSNEPTLPAEHYLRQVDSHENPPVKVIKPSSQNVVYRKEIRIRYLQPPTPPPPAPIIIREKQLPPNPPESPLLIRERKPEARTPPPLTIRERPPTPPEPIEPCIIDKPLPPPPRPPRQIIIERLPSPPPKPRTVIFEKWLPYKKVKRPILLQKAAPLPPTEAVRNVIIEYEPLKAYTVRRVIEEGIFRVDPTQYTNYTTQQSDGNVRMVDRIEDLPPPSEQLMRVLQEYNRESPSNTDQLVNVSHLSNTPIYRQERVHSPGRKSSIHNSVFKPVRHSQSKYSNHSSPKHSPQDSPLNLKNEDTY